MFRKLQTSSAEKNNNGVKNTFVLTKTWKNNVSSEGFDCLRKHTHGLTLEQTYHPFRAIKGYARGPGFGSPLGRWCHESSADVSASVTMMHPLTHHRPGGRKVAHPLIKFESFSFFLRGEARWTSHGRSLIVPNYKADFSRPPPNPFTVVHLPFLQRFYPTFVGWCCIIGTGQTLRGLNLRNGTQCHKWSIFAQTSSYAWKQHCTVCHCTH